MINIRSQSREELGKYVEVKVDECMVKGISVYGTMTVLGAYGNRERAIKVLDYIHSFIEKGYQKDYLSNKYRVKQEDIFDMPIK